MMFARLGSRQGMLVALAALLAVSCAEPVVTAGAVTQQADPCSAFDSRIWAQTVFDNDPEGSAGLDPDGDDLACEDLPLGAAPALWTPVVPTGAVPVALASVTDGDTIDVVLNGRREAVRLVGVDTPETGGPYREMECHGPEGSAFLEWVLAVDGELFIEQDVEDRDRFGRLLRWVWLDLGEGDVYLLNEAVLRAGHGERFRNTPNRRYVAELIEAEAFAQFYGLGLWGACETGFIPILDSPPMGPDASAQPRLQESGCDAAYPDVCIPPPPPDLSCRDVPHTRFRVLPPDPHQFDGNRDGVACEGPG